MLSVGRAAISDAREVPKVSDADEGVLTRILIGQMAESPKGADTARLQFVVVTYGNKELRAPFAAANRGVRVELQKSHCTEAPATFSISPFARHGRGYKRYRWMI